MNKGKRGPEDALAPLQPTITPERRASQRTSERQVLSELGYYTVGDPRDTLRQQALQAFSEMAGGVEGVLRREAFIETAAHRWGLSARRACAAFDACDVDSSGGLNRHEYLLMLASFVHYESARDDGNAGLSHLRQQFETSLTDPGYSGAQRLVLDPRSVVAHGHARIAMASAVADGGRVSEGFHLDPALRAPDGGDWRGTLATPRTAPLYGLMRQVVTGARALARPLPTETQVPNDTWQPNALVQLLSTAVVSEQAKQISALCAEVRRIAAAQPSLVRVGAPAKVFGDTHGQLRDLLLLFELYGWPDHHAGDVETVSYVFNGDYVDRGAHQLEVVLLLFALKALYPERLFLLRGNHEFRSQSVSMGDNGFQERPPPHPSHPPCPTLSCCHLAAPLRRIPHHPTPYPLQKHIKARFASLPDHGAGVFAAVHAAFDWLPLAALVRGSSGAQALVVHGGIGDGSWGIPELATRVPRPLTEEWAERAGGESAGWMLPPTTPPFVNQALWSDPSDSDVDMQRGVHPNPLRGEVIPLFGPDVTAAWCARYSVDLVIRSHQYVREGVKYMHSGRLITVFSARDYFFRPPHHDARNDGALLLLATDSLGALRVRPKILRHTKGGLERRPDDNG